MTFKKTSGIAVSAIALTVAFADVAVASDINLKVGGRVQLDYTLADINDVTDINIDDTEARRARLNVSGTYGDAIKYKFEINKASGKSIGVEDAYLQFKGNNMPFKIKVGQFKTHNSLDEQTSSRFISTLERSAFTDAFGFNRRVGVSVGTSGSNYTFNVGAFTENLETNNGTEEGKAFAARATYNPIKTDETLVHLGASWRYRDKGDTASDLRYRQRPYTHVAPSRIVDTGRFAESDNFIGVEAAVIQNQFWAAGEYGTLGANGSAGNDDADFGGYYLEAGMFFGGKKTYKGGKFNRPVVEKSLNDGGYGALSVVARYDSVDLNDTPVSNQTLDTIVLGVDWWPTKYTRLGVNYFDADAENGSAEGASGIVTRLQFDF